MSILEKLKITRFLSEGEYRRWYFPVRKYPDRFGSEGWILPLVPFALLWYITIHVLIRIYYDLKGFLSDLIDLNDNFK